MKILLGADHRGFKLKEMVKQDLARDGYRIMDVGARAYDKDDDYIDYGVKLVEKLGEADKGVLFCGSGHGMEMVANRFKKIRAALCWQQQLAVQARQHEDINVLVLPADWVPSAMARKIVKAFLETEFSGEARHSRRLVRLNQLGNLRGG